MFLINGQEINQINIADRGLQYGDGLFETIEVIRGKPIFFRDHLSRLTEGCSRLKIPLPDINQLTKEVEQVSSGADHAVIKIIVTRGQGGRGYKQPEPMAPTRIISLHPYRDYPETYGQHGVAAIFCHSRLGINTALAGIKHLNRLEQVMARMEWSGDEIQEGIMLDSNGHVVEGTMTNLFYIKDSIVYTAPIHFAGVSGVMRRIIFKLLDKSGIQVNEHEYSKEQLLSADECLFCNSIIGIWPIRQIEKIKFSPGGITRMLQDEVDALKRLESGHAS